MTEYERIRHACAVVHAMPYDPRANERDPDGDGFQFNDMRDGSPGDCDGKAYTAALMLIEGGTDFSRLYVHVYRTKAETDHAVLQISRSGGCWWVDPTFNVVSEEKPNDYAEFRRLLTWGQVADIRRANNQGKRG